MKLKCTPDDFEVEEKVSLYPSGGPFGLYRLTKTSLGTPEAIDAVLQKWNLARWQVAYAGLKDKHALTKLAHEHLARNDFTYPQRSTLSKAATIL